VSGRPRNSRMKICCMLSAPIRVFPVEEAVDVKFSRGKLFQAAHANDGEESMLGAGDEFAPSEPRNHEHATRACKWFVSLSLALVVGGLTLLAIHAAKPGRQGPAPRSWPNSSRIVPSPNRANLLVFAHPHCPCTRATLGELAAIMIACKDQVQAHLLFVVPGDMDPGWAQGDLWPSAAEIPGVRLAADMQGVEAARFGAETSGQTLLFNDCGSCLFVGGITMARGHAGDNLGRQAIVSWVTSGRCDTTRTPTFGCRLTEEGASARQEELP
jgi:hypothetical protein